MTLQTTGKITLSQIGVEVGQPLLSAVSLDSIELRKLANKTAAHSQISANDFYGRQFGVGAGYALSDFTAVTGLIPGAIAYSNVVYAPEDSSVAIFCDTAASYRINGGAWQDKSVLGDILAGQSIEIRCTSSTSFSTATPVAVHMGANIKTFSVTTGASTVLQIGVYIYGTQNWTYDVYGHRSGSSGTSLYFSFNTPVVANAVNLGPITWNTTINKYYMDAIDYKAICEAYGTHTEGYTRDQWSIEGYYTLNLMDSETNTISGISASSSVGSSGTLSSFALSTNSIKVLGIDYWPRIIAYVAPSVMYGTIEFRLSHS